MIPLPPSAATLKKYGLSEGEWLAILARQFGACAICGKVPSPPIKMASKRGGVVWKGPRLCIDHEHCKGFKKLPPEKRKLRIRGLVCFWCNKCHLGRSINLMKAEAIVRYLEAHNERLVAAGMQSVGAPPFLPSALPVAK